MHASLAAVVIGGTLEALASPPPPASGKAALAQVEALSRALPAEPVPADLLVGEALADMAAGVAAAAAGPAAGGAGAAGVGGGPLDLLEACCLQDDLHLFSPAGGGRDVLTWARLPLPLLYEGSQFCYPLRQHQLAAPLLQLALNRCAAAGWDSCLWHANLPTLAARSAYTLTLLQLAPAEGEDAEDGEEGWQDNGGGFELRQLGVVGSRRSTAHACWQRHATQQPLLLLRDGTLLEARLGQEVSVVEAWRPPPGALPQRLQGALQVAGGAQPRTALLALKDRLARLDLRAGGGGGAASLAHLWRCPPGEHLTAMCVPSCAAPAPAAAAASGLGGGAWEHLLAAAAAGGPGASTRLLLFDLRRPGEPAAAWEQPPFDGRLSEEAALLRWLPAAGSGAAGGGAVLAGACSSGRVSAGQFSPQAAAPALQARGGQIQEQPASAGAQLLERLQASLQQQEDEAQQARQAQQEETETEGSSGEDEEGRGGRGRAQRWQEGQQQGSRGGSALVPPTLQPPPALPLALQLLWQPAHSASVGGAPGPPLTLVPPAEQQPALAERLTAGRLLLRRQQAAAGGGILASAIALAGRPGCAGKGDRPPQLLGLSAVSADWATGQQLPVPLLCTLGPHGDAALSLLQQQAPEPAQQQQHGAAVPVLLPAAPAGGDASLGAGEGEAEAAAAAAGDEEGPWRLLPYVPGVPRALVAAVASGELQRCGCCRSCLTAGRTCATRAALVEAGLGPDHEWAARERFLSNRPSLARDRAAQRRLLTLPAGEHHRSVVQLPLHKGLARLLVQQQAQQAQRRAAGTASEDALRAVLRALRLGSVPLQDLHTAAALQQRIDGWEAPPSSSSGSEGSSSSSSSSSSDEGSSEDDSSDSSDGGDSSGEEEEALSALRNWAAVDEAALAGLSADLKAAAKQKVAAARREARRTAQLLARHRRGARHRAAAQLRRRWRAELRQQPKAWCALAAALLSPLASPGAEATGERARKGGKKRKGAAEAEAAAAVEPGSVLLEAVLQRAGLLPQQRPLGAAGEARAASGGANGSAAAAAGPGLLPSPSFERQVATAALALDASKAAAAVGEAERGAAEAAAAALETAPRRRRSITPPSQRSPGEEQPAQQRHQQQQQQQQQQQEPEQRRQGQEQQREEAHQSPMQWLLRPRRYVVLPRGAAAFAAPAAAQQQQQQAGEEQEPATEPVLPPPDVRPASAAAAVLALMQQPAAAAAEAGPSSAAQPPAAAAAPMAPLHLQAPDQAPSAAAAEALEELRRVWAA